MNLRHLLLLWALVGSVAQTAELAAPVPVKAHLKNGRVMTVELVGLSQGMLQMRESGKSGELSLLARDLALIEFSFDFGSQDLSKLCAEENFTEAARLLREKLEPVYPYLGLPTNAQPYLFNLMYCLYGDGQYEELARVARLMEPLVTDPQAKRERICFAAAGLAGQGKADQAAPLLEQLEPISRTDPQAPLYWISRAQVQLDRAQWPSALESAAQLLAFHGHDREWLGAALWISAKGYGQLRQYEAAESALKEIQTLYPRGRLSLRATQLADELKRRRAEEKQVPGKTPKPKEGS